MRDRPDGCYRWVIFDPECRPEIAYWYEGMWHLHGDVDEDSVHKVGIGGTLDAPPDVWEDDLPQHVYSVFDDTPAYGTDDPDAGVAR